MDVLSIGLMIAGVVASAFFIVTQRGHPLTPEIFLSGCAALLGAILWGVDELRLIRVRLFAATDDAPAEAPDEEPEKTDEKDGE